MFPHFDASADPDPMAVANGLYAPQPLQAPCYHTPFPWKSLVQDKAERLTDSLRITRMDSDQEPPGAVRGVRSAARQPVR
jgi:hypothetical protein